MATVERPALIEVQRGQIMISTTLTPAQLERYAKVDAYDPERGTDPGNGYQRRASGARIAQAAEFYGEGQVKRVGAFSKTGAASCQTRSSPTSARMRTRTRRRPWVLMAAASRLEC